MLYLSLLDFASLSLGLETAREDVTLFIMRKISIFTKKEQVLSAFFHYQLGVRIRVFEGKSLNDNCKLSGTPVASRSLTHIIDTNSTLLAVVLSCDKMNDMIEAHVRFPDGKSVQNALYVCVAIVAAGSRETELLLYLWCCYTLFSYNQEDF